MGNPCRHDLNFEAVQKRSATDENPCLPIMRVRGNRRRAENIHVFRRIAYSGMLLRRQSRAGAQNCGKKRRWWWWRFSELMKYVMGSEMGVDGGEVTGRDGGCCS